jgi:hypothetical protein
MFVGCSFVQLFNAILFAAFKFQRHPVRSFSTPLCSQLFNAILFRVEHVRFLFVVWGPAAAGKFPLWACLFVHIGNELIVCCPSLVRVGMLPHSKQIHNKQTNLSYR